MREPSGPRCWVSPLFRPLLVAIGSRRVIQLPLGRRAGCEDYYRSRVGVEKWKHLHRWTLQIEDFLKRN